MNVYGRGGWKFTSPEPSRYPYPPPVLLQAKCFTANAVQCQGLPSNALDYQSPFTPYDSSVGTNRTGLRVTILVTTTAIFAFLFCFGRYSVLIQYSLNLTGIPPHPLTAIPAFYMVGLAPSRVAKVILRWLSSQHPYNFSHDSTLIYLTASSWMMYNFYI